MEELVASVHIKKKKKDTREYVEFAPQHAVPPILALLFVVAGMALLGFLSYQVWNLGIEALRMLASGLWGIVAILGIVLWRSLYHRRVCLYPARVVVYGIVVKHEMLISNIRGFRYKNPNTILLKHRLDKGYTAMHLDVRGRQYLEEWVQKGFTDLDKI